VRMRALFAVIVVSLVASAQCFAMEPDRSKLPIPDPAFKGKVGETYKDSTPDYPQPVKAPAAAPNVLLILLDDVGFGMTSAFGGPVPTPNLDKLAHDGLSYTRFHTTALCSPTRAALLTGRNHHSVGTGVIIEMATGYPGYTGIIPKSTATIAEVLRDNGYATAMFGKAHNTPETEISPAGPFDNWPTGQGFDYFYGFNQGETNQYFPTLYRGTTPVPQPKSVPRTATSSPKT
jgi:arylsulfatase A-like enzyme